MISLNSLNNFFYNKTQKRIGFSGLYVKTKPISWGEGVPRYTYSEITDSSIPASGPISLGEFEEIRVQTGTIPIYGGEQRMLEEMRYGDDCFFNPVYGTIYHPRVEIKKNGTGGGDDFNKFSHHQRWTEIYIYDKHICNISGFFEYVGYSVPAGEYTYYPFDFKFWKIEIKSTLSGMVHLIVNENYDSNLGQKGSTLNPGTHQCKWGEFALIIEEVR